MEDLTFLKGLLLLIQSQNLNAVILHDLLDGFNAAEHLESFSGSLDTVPAGIFLDSLLPTLYLTAWLDQVQDHLQIYFAVIMHEYAKFIYDYPLKLSKCTNATDNTVLLSGRFPIKD